MVDYLINAPKLNSFVKVLFYLLMIVVATIAAALVGLNINEKVTINNGELFSRNAPIQYKATEEGFIEKIWVNEGSNVLIGDTLIQLRNDRLLSEYAKVKEEYFLQQINLNLDKKELDNREKKLVQLEKRKSLVFAKNKYNKESSFIEMRSAEEQIKALNEKLKLGESRLQKDFQLYKDGALSQLDYEENRRSHLDEINELEESRKNYQLILAARDNHKNQFSENLQSVQLQWINLEQEIIEQKKLIFLKESKIQNLAIQMDFLLKEIKKLTICSSVEGTVISLFNEKYNTVQSEKGITLVTVKPEEAEVFYARLEVSQASISKLKKGQTIHLKLKAYNFLQYGILRGVVETINPKDTTNKFYVLARINEVPTVINLQTGYLVKGDIILQRMKLYRYIMHSMFEKFA